MNNDTTILIIICASILLLVAFGEEKHTTLSQYDPAPERYERTLP